MDLLITQPLSLDFCKSEFKTIKAKQYDKNSRFIKITCTENGKVKTLNTSAKCVFKMLTPDGRAIYDDAIIEANGSILVELTETALAYSGTGEAEINLFDLDSKALLSTKKFNIDIDGSVYPNDTVIATPEFNALTNMIFDVNESIETVNGFKDAENERKENEKNRINAESERENNTKSAITAVNSATASAKEKIEEAEDKLYILTTKIEECDITSEKAEKSAISAENSAKIASEKASEALASEVSASTSAKSAKDSETSTKTSETNSKINQQNAKTSETNAKSSETNAASSASTASTKAIEATAAANNASTSANTSSIKAIAAEKSAKAAESYAVGGTGTRTGENIDNAKYYKEQAERIAQELPGGLIPDGTITFAELPKTSKNGYMYNISDDFVTTNKFKDGAGLAYPAGTNVYYTADGHWDCLPGSSVMGVKGEAESSYRRGNVNLTKADIGLENVLNVSINDQTPTFTQSTAREAFKSGEKLSQILGKVSKWFADLKTGAFSTVVNNDTTTAGGYVADARIVRAHGTEIDNLNSVLATHRTSGDHDSRYYRKEEHDDSFAFLSKRISDDYNTLSGRMTPDAATATLTGASGGYVYCNKYDRVVTTRICIRVLNKTSAFTNYNIANLPYMANDLAVGMLVSQNNGLCFPATITGGTNVLVLENKTATPTSDDWLWGNIVYISK